MMRMLRLALLLLCLLPSIEAAAQRMRGIEVTEKRLALVIGNAAYRADPLDNPVNDARMIGRALQQSGFEVAQHENLDRRGLLEALRQFGSRLNENTIAVLYYAGHGLQLRDRNYLIPVDAEIRNEDEIPIHGIDLGFLLGRMSHARSRINIVILDACRNNPFIGKSGPAAQGLAPMDAPVGTLLAYATAPGKLAADAGGGSANSIYASHLGRHLVTPGLPVEQVFKRVREGVVRDTKAAQVPWESSSLQGEFAFVPGVATGSGTPADTEAAGELAFWNSIQAANRPDEYRAYLRQYPSGRFAALAQTRIAAFTAPAAAPPTATPNARFDTLPRAGDSWRYRVQDQFRIGDLFVTAKVDAVDAQGVSESWTTTSDAKLRTTLVSLEPGFSTLPGWTLTPPEFAPYLQAALPLRAGQRLPELTRRIDQSVVTLRGTVEAVEDIVVAAGRFRALKLVLRGQAATRGSGRAGTVSVEHVVWYVPEVKRSVKATVSTTVGSSLRESTSVELIEYRLN